MDQVSRFAILLSIFVFICVGHAQVVPVITTPAQLPSGSLKTQYSVPLDASGGVAPYTFSATGLPQGLTISRSGVISGIPAVVGQFTITATVTDSQGMSSSKQLFLTVFGVASLVVSPVTMNFMAQVGQKSQPQLAHIQVNSTTAAVKIDPSYDKGAGWLVLNPLSPSLDYNVTADATSLTAGTYTGTLTVSCTGQTCDPSAVPIRVTLVVSASQSKLLAAPASLNFQAFQGRGKTLPQVISVTTDDGGALGFTVTAAPSWARLSTMSGTASSNPAALAVAADPTDLNNGPNNGTITITPANGSPAISVNIAASLSAFSIGVSPSSPAAINLAPGVTQVLPLNVSTVDGLAQDVAISTSGGNWLKAPLAGIRAPGQANITLDSTGLSGGTYSGTVTFSCSLAGSNDAACAPVQVPVTLTVSASNMPAIRSVNGVISASAYGGFNTISPGSYIEIYGTNLSSTIQGRTWTGNDFTNNGQTAPKSLDGTTVSVGGQAAFVFFVSPTQVNALVPSNAGTGPSQLTLTSPTGTTALYPVTINPLQPGLLAPAAFQIGGKQYVAALLDPQASIFAVPAGAIPKVNSRPAKPGETIVIYGVGFGPVTPQIDAGTVVSQANSLVSPLQVLFGDSRTPARLDYSGLAPNFTGLYQLNVVVPAVPDNDAVPLRINLGGVDGMQTLYTAVHR